MIVRRRLWLEMHAAEEAERIAREEREKEVKLILELLIARRFIVSAERCNWSDFVA